MSDVGSVQSSILIKKTLGFRIRSFCKLQFPPESNERFPTNYFFNFCSRQKLPVRNEIWTHFLFENGGMWTTHWFPSYWCWILNARWTPLQQCADTCNTYKEPARGWWVFLTRERRVGENKSFAMQWWLLLLWASFGISKASLWVGKSWGPCLSEKEKFFSQRPDRDQYFHGCTRNLMDLAGTHYSFLYRFVLCRGSHPVSLGLCCQLCNHSRRIFYFCVLC